MKINVFFVAAALAYGSSLVMAQEIVAPGGVDVDAREFKEDLEAREPELTIDIDARELDDDLEAREDDDDIFAREPVSV